jgi:putative salt-induced outer membrane protein YdiY
MSPLGRTFWRRLDGGIDAGFNFTEANVQTQWTFHSTVSYRSRYWFSEISGDSLLTTREDADRQTRNTMSFQSQRSMGPRWSTSGFAQLQQNEELSLDLRTVFGAGVGRILTQSNRTAFVMLGALAFTHEQYQDVEPDDVAEAVGGVNWEWFTFDGRSTNLDIGAISFYALNHDSRIRLELNSSFKSDIVGDLYWSVNLFESYNSAPPTGQKKNDSGVSAAIGWTF